MDDGRRGARGVRPQPGRLPWLNLRGTCSSGGSHVVSFVWRAGGSRDPHSRPRRRPGAAPGWPRAANGLRGPGTEAGKGEACVWSRRRVSSGAILPRVENWATDPGVTTPPLRAAGDEHGAPPAHLPAPEREANPFLELTLELSYSLGGRARPLWGGERGCPRADFWLPGPTSGEGGRRLGPSAPRAGHRRSPGTAGAPPRHSPAGARDARGAQGCLRAGSPRLAWTPVP